LKEGRDSATSSQIEKRNSKLAQNNKELSLCITAKEALPRAPAV
jgi:hypothetical protein